MSRRGTSSFPNRRVPWSGVQVSRHIGGRIRRWVTKNDADDPTPTREHARRIAAAPKTVHRTAYSKDEVRLVHAAREQLARDRNRKTAKRRRQMTKASRRANR